jgi:hypothetical protein
MPASRAGAGLLVLLALAGCSYHWDASMRLKGAARPGLVVSMTSSLGDHFQAPLAGGCVDARIRQSPKLPNRITITVTGADGKVVGTALTNDLDRRPFEIALAGGGAITVTPGAACKD